MFNGGSIRICIQRSVRAGKSKKANAVENTASWLNRRPPFHPYRCSLRIILINGFHLFLRTIRVRKRDSDVGINSKSEIGNPKLEIKKSIA